MEQTELIKRITSIVGKVKVLLLAVKLYAVVLIWVERKSKSRCMRNSA